LRKASAVLAALLALALVGTGSVSAAVISTGQQQAATPAAPAPPKIVIIVGAVEGTTSSYRAKADAEYNEAIKYTPNVVKVYSPNATWAAVQAAVDGASIVIYHGHGNGWPSPYTYDPQYKTKDGFGLNATAGAGDYNLKYYGEPSIRTLRFAPYALVFLHNLCYASGNSEPGHANPTLNVAKQRVENYASAFLAAGAKAVIAGGHGNAIGYLQRLFTVDETILENFRNQHDYNGNEIVFNSSRTPGAVAVMDPDQPQQGFYRSVTGDLNTRNSDVTGLTAGQFSPTCPATHLRASPSTSSTSEGQVGTSAIVTISGIVSGDSWTTNCLGDCPTARSGSSWYVVSTINGESVSSLYGESEVYVPTGALYQTFGDADPAPSPTPTPGPTAAAGTYVALTPNRLLDSRAGNGFTGPLKAGVARSFQVTGRNPGNSSLNVPSNALAVTGTLTVTNATSGGWVSLTPELDNNPGTSTINVPAGDIRANGVTVPLGGGGILSVAFNGPASGHSAHVVFDVTGYFVPDNSGARYSSVTPNRLLDSRSGNGFSGPLQKGVARSFQVTARKPGNASQNIPSTAIAVTGNVTVTGPTAAGWITVTPALDNNPSTSTLNFPAGDTRASGLTLPLGPGGTLSIVYSGPPAGGTTDVVFDVTGYFVPGTTGARYVALSPNRLVDARYDLGFRGPMPISEACGFQVTGRHPGDGSRNVPTSAVAVTGNLTVTSATAPGWLTVTPTLSDNPSTSTLNFPAWDTRANGLTVQLGGGGILSVAHNGSSFGNTAQAIFDITGYFTP
jgi:hypothetical protein